MNRTFLFVVSGFLIFLFLIFEIYKNAEMDVLIVNRIKQPFVGRVNKIDEEVNDGERLRKRKELAKKVCLKYRNLYSNSKLVHKHLTDKHFCVKYCWIEKVGSSLMKEFFRHLDYYAVKRNISNCYPKSSLQKGQVYANTSFGSSLVGSNIDFTKIMIVRDPYERLFSGYVDKFFSPSTIFWKKRGRYILSNFRSTFREKDRLCGHNVTFVEFIRYVIHFSTKNKKMDEPHFTPMHEHCKPCLIKYDYIWKLETIKDDLKFTLNELQNKFQTNMVNFSFYMKKEHIETDVYSRINNLFQQKSDIERCMSFHEASLRIWQGFKMRGLIDKTLDFPYKYELPTNFSFEVFKTIVDDAIRGGNKSLLKTQKREAFLEAYSLLPKNILNKLETSVVNIDKEIFGCNKNITQMLLHHRNGKQSYFSSQKHQK